MKMTRDNEGAEWKRMEPYELAASIGCEELKWFEVECFLVKLKEFESTDNREIGKKFEFLYAEKNG